MVGVKREKGGVRGGERGCRALASPVIDVRNTFLKDWMKKLNFFGRAEFSVRVFFCC